MKLADVYLEVGFKIFRHFSKTFKQEFGYNPSNIRRHYNKAIGQAS